MHTDMHAQPPPHRKRKLKHSLIVGAPARIVIADAITNVPASLALSSKRMRVIAGHYRSRPLLAPRGNATRPTSDRLRETLFNVLGPRVPGARFADLYAGSGAVGIEALSRGATHCLFVEQAPPALAALRKNLSNLALEGSATIDSRPAAKALLAATKASASYDLVFLDPPYEAASEYVSTLNILSEHATILLAESALIVAEHARRAVLSAAFGRLHRTRLLEQGDAALSFYSLVEPTAP